ncbi:MULTISPECIES: ABC transporter ATP-binding protein [Carnobacterium]|uniref:Multidrug ABC transporter ATP-binding protein n=2 Tax=Carnobacterium inhibens TaxID=147709 RepID=U5SBI5_9LACT|nr:ABC transporter ATP-binding protein [Carnobacterium inhibens]AGY81468.1 multidrug ABC transporter ATP-binding protein [Carnobacterium inhibens subsp. gilichinskyi]MBC9825020.1 ATP-binding cassette domain-containing protein [Carnobacterium inhibens]MCM3512782.1 ABC transporter ATP-binding protein/permease [Carnobacterium inhibens]
MNLMWRYTMKYKKLVFLNFLCVFGFILIELGLPTLLAQLINKGLMFNDFDVVTYYGKWMLVISVIGLFGLIGLAYTVSKITTRIVRDIRNDIFEKVQSFSHKEYNEFGVSSLVTRTTNDAFQIMVFLQMVLRIGMMTPLMFISSFVMIVRTSPSLSYIVLIAVPFLLGSVYFIGKYSGPLSNKQQTNLDDINLNLRENLTGLRVIRAFVKEKFQENRFYEVNENYMTVSKKLFKLMALAMPIFSIVFNCIFAIVIWLGAIEINAGDLQVGSLVAFIEYIFHALFSFMMFANIFTMYPRAAVSARRIQEIFDTKPSITENENGITETKTHGYLAFENVTFAYPGNTEEPVIENISFTVRPGETTAFIGSTGSGKSSLIQLIPRFYDVTKGRILVDGVDVRDYKLSALRQKIGYIPQKALLFTGTISDNMRYGKWNANKKEVEEASDISQSKDFILKKPDQFDEFLSEGGSNMSGGQKQRLSIARAIIKKPDIYVFDDSFSALDYQTDAKLRARLKLETKNAAVLIVAQRVGTIMHADNIIVLNKGVVVAQGTHEELLKKSDVYYDIASSQLSKEELA